LKVIWLLGYWRVEFQQKGSPHIHDMFWLKDASEVDFTNEESMYSVIAFIDQVVTVDVTNTDLAPYVENQKHKLGHSCLKKVRGQSVCRFGIPYPSIPQTEMLKPLPEETQINAYNKHILSMQRANMDIQFIMDP